MFVDTKLPRNKYLFKCVQKTMIKNMRQYEKCVNADALLEK